MKNLKLLSALALVGLLVISCSTMDKYRAPDTKGLTLEEAVSVLNTPEKINAWIDRNMTWYRSGSFRIPEEIFESKRGSCIHYANVAAFLLDRNGYEVEVLYVRYMSVSTGGISAHAVCVYKKDGKWWTCGDSRGRHAGRYSNYRYAYYTAGPFKTLEDAARWTAGDHGVKYYSTKTHRTFEKLSEMAAKETQPK